MAREHFRFPGSQGATLAGHLETPPGTVAAYALFAHCFTCSKDLKSAGVLCHELVGRGIAVMRFDFTGAGQSAGDFADTNFSSNVQDLVAAADLLRREHRAPALLIGHSLGGTAMLAAAPHIPEAAAVVTIGAPSDTRHLHDQLTARVAERLQAAAGPDGGGPEGQSPALPDDGVLLDLGGTVPVRIRRQLLDDLGAEHMKGVVHELHKALLICHSPVDRVVGIEHAEHLFREARHPKSFLSLGQADHLLSDPRDAAHVGAVVAAWAGRYLADQAALDDPATAGTAPATRPLAPGEVEVTGDAGSLRQEIRAGAHQLLADEPEAAGGTDRGPTPYGFLLAALGACTGITLRLYADRKRLPLTGSRIRLRHSRDHEADCEHCEESSAQLERIERELELQGPLTEDQRTRLLAIANRCPVHRTLTGKLEIVTRLV
jgi:uncharacterized OsmC-like protein/alpha/beta superfamily hydrolase